MLPPNIRQGRLMQVVHETPLLMGPNASTARSVGVLEVGAKLDSLGLPGGETLEVRFYPALLTPPDGMLFFARATDLLAEDDL